MSLHPQCKAFLDQLAAAGGKQLYEMTPAEARATGAALIDLGVPVQEVARIENRTVPGPAQPIPIRIYKPVPSGTLSALVYFHGGGWVIGGLESHDRECRALANLSGCTVIAVDYRLAPEHPFPAAVEDAYAATSYVAEHAAEFGIDPQRIAVGGDSSGGNLAAVVTLMAREKGGPKLAFQLLIYPGVDLADDHRPSMIEFAEGHFLTRPLMDYFANHYIPKLEDRRRPDASPLYATDFRGLPPALVITAECDLLRDQGELYAQKLREAGVPVSVKRYDGMIHPFFSFGGILDDGRAAVTEAATAVRAALSPTAVAG
nr:lipolytic enzyme SBLip5.1 [uncultured bacterium]